jgi:TRAP-type C4-dicarboxylate transport system permease small subunit
MGTKKTKRRVRMSRFRKIVGILERSLYLISERVRLVAEFLMGGMVMLIVADVFLRYCFNRPLPFSLELIQIGLSLTVFCGMVICTAKKGHIVMDIFVHRFPQRLQTAMSSFFYFLCTGLLGVMTWQYFVYAMATKESGAESPILKIPIYTSYLVIAVCVALVFLLLMSQFIHFTAEAVSK